MRSRWAAVGLTVAGLSCRSTGTFVARREAPAPPQAETRTSAEAARANEELQSAEVDRRIREAWQARGIIPASSVDDARFLRRVYLDIVGRIPTIDEIDQFERDGSNDRRRRVVDALLSSPGYADHWTNYWEDVLLLDKVDKKFVDRDEFRRFLHAEFEQNVSWNQVVVALIAARGVNREPEKQTTDASEASVESRDPKAHTVNGAVNWLMQYRDRPQDLAGKVASTFLGVKIQCAECHDHKTEKWKQKDFRSFASFFTRMKAIPIEWQTDGSPERVELFEVGKPVLRIAKNPEIESIAAAPPVALDGTDFSDADNRREALAAWTTSARNAWFATAIVNRVWGYFLGRAFVEPVDDLRDSNPSVLPSLLGELAGDFAANGYDIKRLIRIITATDVYQLASAQSPRAPGIVDAPRPRPSDGEGELWSRYPLKPLDPDQLLDSIATATDLDEFLAAKKGPDFETVKARIRRDFDFVFDIDEESHPLVYEGTLPQAFLLMNGREVNQIMRVGRQGALLKVLANPVDDEQRIEALYLRTLSRRPTPEELEASVKLVTLRGARRQRAFEDLFWALLNSSEFVFNH